MQESLGCCNESYNKVLKKRGILPIDQELGIDTSSVGLARQFALHGNGFSYNFAAAMAKLQVMVWAEGEIRKNCRVFYPPSIASIWRRGKYKA
ncbi:hypothetical protein AMTRI_Chr04g250400 [Amborella trichopoda]